MTKLFDPTKPVQTRDGCKARIICTDRKTSDLQLGLVALIDVGDREIVRNYLRDGRHLFLIKHSSDLINIPEITKEYRRVWVGTEVDRVSISFLPNQSEELCRAGAGDHKRYIGILVIEKTDGEISDSYFIPWEKKA